MYQNTEIEFSRYKARTYFANIMMKGRLFFDENTVYFNTIYIIESLNEQDRATGRALYDDLLRRKPYFVEHLSVDYIKVNTQAELIYVLVNIHKRIRKYNLNPFIHIEVHANRSELELSSGERISWGDLLKHFVEINYQTYNNLFVSFASCYAANALYYVDLFDRSPFRVMIAPLEKVSSSDIEEGYNAFFDHLFKYYDISRAFRELNNSIERPQFKLLAADKVFDFIWNLNTKDMMDYNESVKHIVYEKYLNHFMMRDKII